MEFVSESSRQETTLRRREYHFRVFAKPLSGCAYAPVSLPRTVCGVAPALLTWSWLSANVRNRTAIEPANAQNSSSELLKPLLA